MSPILSVAAGLVWPLLLVAMAAVLIVVYQEVLVPLLP
ncbi:hypothetical protein HaLaN_07980 [Haematococcus lacustris]|uniref:Uncharacterized protein n=1 Tax=Haematococcus lacustris TaxID=44745 RepID=A0A699YRS4_HAELA|nr:hypothetical protein HaLaN_07980 [Haematococcus lacustris]